MKGTAPPTILKTLQVKDILQLTSHAMLRAVRVVLANGSLAEARDLHKMLTKAISTVRETGKLLGSGFSAFLSLARFGVRGFLVLSQDPKRDVLRIVSDSASNHLPNRRRC